MGIVDLRYAQAYSVLHALTSEAEFKGDSPHFSSTKGTVPDPPLHYRNTRLVALMRCGNTRPLRATHPGRWA